MHLAAESIPGTEKRGAVNASITLKMSLYNCVILLTALEGGRERETFSVEDVIQNGESACRKCISSQDP
jgi:hypothetical protein